MDAKKLPLCVVTPSIAYWLQCRREELDEFQDEDDAASPEIEGLECDCSRCMACLGLSWRDFL